MVGVIAWAGVILLGLLLVLAVWGGIVWVLVRLFPRRVARVLGLPHGRRPVPTLSNRQLPDLPPEPRR